MNRTYRRLVMLTAVFAALGVAAWAQDKKKAADVEGQVRAASFRYYVTTVFGDADEHLKVARIPLLLVHDGAVSHRDEKATRTLLAGFADRMKKANLSADDRKQMTGKMVELFDEASVQFVGANTAEVTFLVKAGAKPEDGESLATLILARKDNEWRVVGEVTDSAPVPASYLLDVPKKP